MTMKGTPSISFSWLGNQLLPWFSNMLPILIKMEFSTGLGPMAGEKREEMFLDNSGSFYSTADWINPAACQTVRPYLMAELRTWSVGILSHATVIPKTTRKNNTHTHTHTHHIL